MCQLAFEGVISFEKNVKSTDRIIYWENGFLSLSKLAPLNEPSKRFIYGANFVNRPGSAVQTDNDVYPVSEHRHFEAPEKILEEFESGFWFNQATQTLYLKRDIFGTIPFYYLYLPGQFIAFSSSLVTLVNLDLTRPYLETDRLRINAYLSYKGDQASNYSDRTFFKHIKTVLPGHTAVIGTDSFQLKRNKSYSPSKWSHLTDIGEIGDTFKKLLFDSVERSVKSLDGPIGSHLSGGMDSSALSTITKLLRPESELHTLYLDTKTKYSDEANYAAEVAANIHSIHHQVPPLEADFDIISLYTSIYGHPECMVISPAAQGSLMKEAADLGCKSLLIGHDGDSVVGSGLELINLTYAKGDWSELKTLIRLRAQHATLYNSFPEWDSYDEKKRYELLKRTIVVNEFFRHLSGLPLRKSFKLLVDSSAKMDIPLWYFLKKGFNALGNRLRRWKEDHLPTSVTTEFLQQDSPQNHSTPLSDLLRGELPQEYKMPFDDVFNGQALVASEQFYALANYYKIATVFPFYDTDLFEFCLSLSMKTKFGTGIGRQHFREAMKGLLPENVRTRSSKANFIIYGRQATLRLVNQSADLMDREDNPVWKYVEKEKYDICRKILLTEGLPDYKHSRSQFFVARTISLAIWLNWLRENNLN